ncbi:MAG: PEP/pyruvate-binding domain-containing protein [Candidatus Binatia bacterium]
MRNNHARVLSILALAGVVCVGSQAAFAMREPQLSPAQAAALKRDFAPCLTKLKGPFTENFCVCRKSGEKRPVMDKAGRITSPCGNDALFCAAFRAPWAEGLAKEGVWIANIFSRDLWLWPQIADHHDLIRGYILEKYFVDTNPTHKLAQLRAYGGLSGSEYETGASTALFERYLAEPGFDDSRHFPLAYELQRRFFVNDDLGQVEKVRSMAVRIQAVQPKFKPLRDAIHNQLSASLIPKVAAYRDQMAPGPVRTQVEGVIAELSKLTALDENALKSQLADLSDARLRSELTALLPGAGTEPVAAMTALGKFMLRARQAVAARHVSIPDVRRLIDLGITSGAVMQKRGAAMNEAGKPLSVRQDLELLAALTDAAYGTGQLVAREHEAASRTIAGMLAVASPERGSFTRELRQVGRVVEWAQANALLSFAEVWPQWTYLMPQVGTIGDDILRSSPLLLFAEVYSRLDGYAAGSGVKRHDFFGAEVTSDVRALNPGLAVGTLKVGVKVGQYASNEIVALTETPAELEPAAGILTEGEGNILSHVQLLARSLGIPNVVLGPSAFDRVKPHDGETVFFASTPGGRVVIKPVTNLTGAEKAAWQEYTKNDVRSGNGRFGSGNPKLHIDTARIDLTKKMPIDLSEIRRSDSGVMCGPKAAFLGELKHLFPDKVARGIVVPFGAYRDFYDKAPVAVPDSLRSASLATPGESLKAFVEKSFGEFFDVRVPAAKDPRALTAWIAPRLEIIRYSIRQAPLSSELRAGIRDSLDRAGLLRGAAKTETVGCFIRSDTNVEDLDTFNGAGLNLTLFNIGSLEDIYEGLREVWASPFQLRSFSWRQTLIDEPLWVLPSVVILESIPSEKSGVLVTCDIETGDPTKMVIATSEGVGGAVDGTSAETLLWSPEQIEVLTLYKSPWKNSLIPGGGSRVVASSGKDEVLSPRELDALVAAGKAVQQKLEPARDSSGRPRPWDIEFGFSDGKLWLFQSRPFIGNESVKNVPALAVLDGSAVTAAAKDRLSLAEVPR